MGRKKGYRKAQSIQDRIANWLSKYKIAKKAKVGETFICPGCKKEVLKNTYQKTFCSNKGKKNCKDKFWNLVDPEKRCRNTPYFYNVILENYAKERGFPSYEEMEDNLACEDGSWDAGGIVEIDICDICNLRAEYCQCGSF